jgi:hypothetical protein
MQMIHPEKRNFPFASRPTLPDTTIVDMIAYCKVQTDGMEENQAACSDTIVA